MADERIELPALNVACCGIAPEGSESGWVRLADELEGMTGWRKIPTSFGADARSLADHCRRGWPGCIASSAKHASWDR